MVIKKLDKCDELWNRVADYAKECSWGAGKFLAEQMYGNGFSEWERVIAAFDEENVIGYCTLAKNDCLPDVPYTPYIGYVFVDERYRGNRHSQKMIDFALGYARELGFDKVYLVSDHVNLYEKYGFVKIDEKPAAVESGGDGNDFYACGVTGNINQIVSYFECSGLENWKK